MIQSISYSVLHGFAIYSVIGFIANFFLSETNKEKLTFFDLSASQIGALAGFIYLAMSAVSTLELGRYAPVIWIHLLMILSVQLVWSDKLRKLKWLRLLIAILLLFSVEGWIIMITSMHRDYMPSAGSLPFGTFIGMWFIDLGIFAFVSGLFHYIKSYFRH